MRKAKQNTAKNVMVLMVDSTDHVTGKTGLTLTVMASKDGGAFASITPTVTERSYGTYNLALTAAHTNTLGDLALHVSAAGADPADLILLVEAGSTDADVSSRLATAGYTAPPTAAAIRTEIDANSTKLDAAVSTRLATASYTAPPTAAAIRTEIDANSTKLDAAISTRLATAGYTAPNNAGIASILAAVDTEVAAILAAVDTEVAAIKARTDNLPADTGATLASILGYIDELESRLTVGRAALLDNLDAAVSSRLATAGYTAPPSAASNAAATLAAAEATPIHSDMRKAVGQDYHGDGSANNKLRSTLVP